MRNTTKKIITLAFIALFAITALAGCGNTADSGNTNSESETVTLKVGASITPHSEILEQAKPILAEQGVNLEIVQIEDSVTPNTGLAEGSLDANFFQHQPYLNDFNSENGTDLVSVGAVHYEPFGIYAGKTTKLSDLPDGATVAVPNNTTNEARALLLLQQEGIITLKEGADIRATIQDIAENPKNLQFTEIAPEQLVNALPDVEIAVINGNYAIEGGLKVKDALAVESDQGVAAKTYENILVVQKKDENNAAVKKLIDVLQSDTIRSFIEETYGGAVVPIK
ncbi:MAG: MetQ/NlpA family ABC transporter substrate-binding protein [Oscillospiraceae bacterium]|jgi:D-methionine transport system substrate-binding protein|nr:MetQ/NlpA family ABC transporter substrate-binding protein [Oscillospiraceae bacterium]